MIEWWKVEHARVESFVWQNVRRNRREREYDCNILIRDMTATIDTSRKYSKQSMKQPVFSLMKV